MAQLLIDSNFQKGSSSSEEIDIENNDVFNYRGYFQDNDDDDGEPKYFEHGAHFPYLFLFQKLQILQQIQMEEEEKTTTTKKKDAAGVLVFNNNTKSRNRRHNHEADFSEIPKHEEAKEPHNASAIVLKIGTSNPKQNKKETGKETVGLYTTFASKLKMNKHLEFSKKVTAGEEEIKKNNTNKNSKMKNNIHLSSEKISKGSHSTTKQRNKLEKKILVPSTTCNIGHKKTRSKSKELSSSYNKKKTTNSTSITHKNNNTGTKIITSSLNNILTSYKHKRNANFSPGLHPQPTKVTQKGGNNLICEFNSRNKLTNKLRMGNKKIFSGTSATNTCGNHNLNLNFGLTTVGNNNINVNNGKENSSITESKKKLTISTEKDHNSTSIKKHIQGLNNHCTKRNQKNDIMDSITQTSYHKSRNVNIQNELTATSKENRPNHHLTQQNLHRKNIFCSDNKNLRKQIPNKTVMNPVSFKSKGLGPDERKVSSAKVTKTKENMKNSKKFKTYLNIKLNLYQKTNDQIINEIKKTIGVTGFLHSSSSKSKSKKSSKALKQNSKSNIKPSSSVNTRNHNANCYNPKTVNNVQGQNQKNMNNNINISININNNTNKVIYNKIVNISSKSNNRDKGYKPNSAKVKNDRKNILGCPGGSYSRNSKIKQDSIHSSSISKSKYYQKKKVNHTTTSVIGQNSVTVGSGNTTTVKNSIGIKK